METTDTLHVICIDPDHECQAGKNFGGLGGWVKEDTTWPEFLDCWEPHVHPHLEAIRRWVVENKHRTALENDCIVLSDGWCWGASFRCSGDLLAAIWNGEGERHNYMHFYMKGYGTAQGEVE